MARALGARAQMALAYEMVYGTPPISGFSNRSNVGEEAGGNRMLISIQN